jgi:hypothetical protein
MIDPGGLKPGRNLIKHAPEIACFNGVLNRASVACMSAARSRLTFSFSFHTHAASSTSNERSALMHDVLEIRRTH